MAIVEIENYLSPSGESIEVMDDRSFALSVQMTTDRKTIGQLLKLSAGRRAALTGLWFGGRVESSSGQATRLLFDRVVTEHRYGGDLGSIAAAFKAPTFRYACDVDTRAGAKRTYSIQLVRLPRRWVNELELTSTIAAPPGESPAAEPEGSAALAGSVVGTDRAAAEAVAALVLPVPESVQLDVSMPPALEPLTPVELELMNGVATALLTQVVEIISTGNGGAAALSRLQLDFTAVEERLAQQVEYVSQLRKQLRLAGDEIAALKVERDGLRQRLRTTEHNLKVATSAQAQRLINDEAQRQIDRVMRQTPVGANSRVAAVEEARPFIASNGR